MAKDELNAGFTGSPTEQPEGVRKIAKTATDAVKRETSALAVGAAEHPHTASTLILGIGALAFTVGYLVGRSSATTSHRYWR
ncbi:MULTISPECIES: hypothetical protein [unclassified Sinorhizobium]|uniref:hypothetical protein n=1 Tax=unclassified Sinorhizobium TaxID=2613772 RepID=UPI0035264551